LSPRSREIVADGGNGLFFSAASGWEVVIKARLGKLQVPDDPERFLTEQLSRTAILVLSVYLGHALCVYALPDHHRHPFDRLLISQVLLENLPVLSADSQLARYEVEVLG